MLDPAAVASKTFGTARKGFDPAEVHRFLIEVADELRTLSDADAFSAELLRQAQEEMSRLQVDLDTERNRTFAEGEPARVIIDEARSEAAHILAEAEAARERVLRDLVRRRKEMRTQVEQLHAAREELLRAMTDVTRMADEARSRLVVALPEAKAASDAAARRVQAEDDVTVPQLEAEIEAFRLAGLSLVAAEDGEPAPDVVEGVADVVDVQDVEIVEEEAPDPEEPPEPDEPPEPEVHAVAQPVEPVRRGPTVRVFRSSAPAAEAPAPEPVPEPEAEPAPAAEVEVEVAPVAEVEVAPVAVVEAVAEVEPAAEVLDTETVDALFARLRAGRAARTAEATAVLAEAEPEPEPVAAPVPDVEPVVIEDVAVHVGGGPDRGALLARRDELLAVPAAALGRRLKRLLADEQNTVLDAIRRSGVDGAVGDAGDLAAAWASAAGADLALAATAGAAFVDQPDAAVPDLADISAELVAGTAVQLAEHLVGALRRSDGDAEVAADAVRSVCREWRSRRLGDAVAMAAHAAFGRGALAAVQGRVDGAALCWVVDDGGSPCPDAEDNALAGPMPAGEAFPTGHRHPPAHPGCRCVLAVAELATSHTR